MQLMRVALYSLALLGGGVVVSGGGGRAAISKWSGSADFASFSGQGCQTLTFSAPGAIVDEPVMAGGCGSIYSFHNNLTCSISITAADTASVRLCCTDVSGCSNPGPITFSITTVR